MPVIKVDETSADAEVKASERAIRDFLFMYFEISGDCLPAGDWARAELGDVDPFRYLEFSYEYAYQIRSDAEIRFMREAAAINLLCRVARVHDADDDGESTYIADFREEHILGRPLNHKLRHWSMLTKTHAAFESGRVINTPAIQAAVRVACQDTERFLPALANVLTGVIHPTFAELST